MFMSKIHFYSLLYYLSYFGNCGIHIKFYQWKENFKENVIQKKAIHKIRIYMLEVVVTFQFFPQSNYDFIITGSFALRGLC